MVFPFFLYLASRLEWRSLTWIGEAIDRNVQWCWNSLGWFQSTESQTPFQNLWYQHFEHGTSLAEKSLHSPAWEEGDSFSSRCPTDRGQEVHQLSFLFCFPFLFALNFYLLLLLFRPLRPLRRPLFPLFILADAPKFPFALSRRQRPGSTPIVVSFSSSVFFASYFLCIFCCFFSSLLRPLVVFLLCLFMQTPQS